jgi:hypothetical protein
MSVASLIQQYGRTVTRRRVVEGRTALGGIAPVGYNDAPIVMLIQVGGGATSTRYGAERARYSAVGYCEAGTDIQDGDLAIAGDRTFRVDSVRVPDERPIGDSLSYVICGLEQDNNAP